MDAFAPDGYVLLSGTVPQDALAAYPDALAAAREGLLARRPGTPHAELATSAPDGGTVDPYAIVDAARTLLLAPPLVELLTRAYDDKPLLFDALGTAAGAPADGPYRDATYTALATEPETLVTILVALAETAIDVFPGSQAIATTPFSGRYRAFNPERDGDDALARHRDELTTQLEDGAESKTITLHPGDVLAWAAALVHTAPHGDALVAHLCPVRVHPAWFAYRPERARMAAAADGTAWLTTQHYDLVDAITPEPQDTPVEDERELQRVEAALQEHDADNAPAPKIPNAGARRQGGLVDSVRGILGRRGRGGGR